MQTELNLLKLRLTCMSLMGLIAIQELSPAEALTEIIGILNNIYQMATPLEEAGEKPMKDDEEFLAALKSRLKEVQEYYTCALAHVR